METIVFGNGSKDTKNQAGYPSEILATRKCFEVRFINVITATGYQYSASARGLKMTELRKIITTVKGAGEMASAVAWRLYMANLQNIIMLDTAHPLAVRREVSFCEAVYEGCKTVEGVDAVRVGGPADIHQAWKRGKIAVMADQHWQLLQKIQPDIVVDAILAKRNLGTRKQDAALVIGLGPGFSANVDVHLVIETNRGHNLGRIITDGSAAPNTGIPGAIDGFTEERVLRAPIDGRFTARRSIGDLIKVAEVIGFVQAVAVRAKIAGVIRGLIRSNTPVTEGLKIGDIDPRGQAHYCYTISDKSRAIAGSVLEAVLRVYN
jgi:xanthine dehydrogenase accessory factor